MNFTRAERGTRFVLHCTLLEKDIRRSELITYFTSIFLPTGSPVATESIRFGALVPTGRLDKDIGKEEVYAKLTLVNLSTMLSVTEANTNIVKRRF